MAEGVRLDDNMAGVRGCPGKYKLLCDLEIGRTLFFVENKVVFWLSFSSRRAENYWREGHKGDEGTGASLSGGEAERSGAWKGED